MMRDLLTSVVTWLLLMLWGFSGSMSFAAFVRSMFIKFSFILSEAGK